MGDPQQCEHHTEKGHHVRGERGGATQAGEHVGAARDDRGEQDEPQLGVASHHPHHGEPGTTVVVVVVVLAVRAACAAFASCSRLFT